MAYEFDGFGVTAAYSNSKRTNDQQDRDGNDRAGHGPLARNMIQQRLRLPYMLKPAI